MLQLYTSFSMDNTIAAMKQKGFDVSLHVGTVSPPETLRKELEKSNQLWVISDCRRLLSAEHLAVIKEFFEKGRGV